MVLFNPNYKYPESIEDLNDGDKYQVRFPFKMSTWSLRLTYKSNICSSKKADLQRLILQNRLRVLV